MKIFLDIKKNNINIAGNKNINFFIYGYLNKYYYGFENIDNKKIIFFLDENISDDFNYKLNVEINFNFQIENNYNYLLIQIDENKNLLNLGFKEQLKNQFLYKNQYKIDNLKKFFIEEDDNKEDINNNGGVLGKNDLEINNDIKKIRKNFLFFLKNNFIDKNFIENTLKNTYNYGLNKKTLNIKNIIFKKDIFNQYIKMKRQKDVDENFLKEILNINYIDNDEQIINLETRFLSQIGSEEVKDDKESMYIFYSYIKYIFNINHIINKIIIKNYYKYENIFPDMIIKYYIYLLIILFVNFNEKGIK